MMFTITGEHSGMTYGLGVSRSEAAMYAINNGFADTYAQVEAMLACLGIGAIWKSHQDARGIKITRTA